MKLVYLCLDWLPLPILRYRQRELLCSMLVFVSDFTQPNPTQPDVGLGFGRVCMLLVGYRAYNLARPDPTQANPAQHKMRYMFAVHFLVAEHVPVSGFASAGLGWVGLGWILGYWS